MITVAVGSNLTRFLVTIAVWNFIVSLDGTALSTALPTISEELGATSTEAFWCGSSFLLCSAAAQPVMASLSESFGRRPLVLLALILFTAGAIICSVAHHVSILILGRSIQGLGGGGLLVFTYVLMADNLTLQDRHKAIGVVSLMWLVGPVLGPILSGVFTEKATWRWIFYFNLPWAFVAILLAAFFLKSDYVSPHTGLKRFRVFDWLGALIFVSSLTSFLLAISWGGTMFAWSAAATLVPLILGTLGLLLWLFYSLKEFRAPIIPLQIMRDRTVLISYVGNLVHGIGFFGVLYYLPLYFQAVKGYSPIISGLGLLPSCLSGGPLALLIALLIGKTGRIKCFTIAGWLWFMLVVGLLVLLGPETTTAQWIFITAPAGMGIFSLYPALGLATQAACESEEKSPAEVERFKALAAGLNPFFRVIGQTLGIVIAQAAFTNQMKKKLGDVAARDAMSLSIIISSTKSPAEQAELRNKYSQSLAAVWWTFVGLNAAMLVVTLFTKDKGLGMRAKPDRATDIEAPMVAPLVSSPEKSRFLERKFSSRRLLNRHFLASFHTFLNHRSAASHEPTVLPDSNEAQQHNLGIKKIHSDSSSNEEMKDKRRCCSEIEAESC